MLKWQKVKTPEEGILNFILKLLMRNHLGGDLMIFEITAQVRVKNFNEGQKWYITLFNRKPDFIPHEGFAEWEIISGC